MSDWGKVKFDKSRKRFAVVGTWQGQRHYFSQYLGIPCQHEYIADRLLSTIRSDIDQGIFQPERYKRSKPLHLAKYADRWLEQIKADIALGTWYGYETDIRLYIKPVLGEKFLADIGYQDLKKLMDSMQGLAVATKQNIMGCLHKLMMDAQRDGHIKQLPPWIEFRGANSPVLPEIQYLDVQTQQAVITHIPIEHRPIFLFMMATGCRPSEARAFRKQDIHENYIIFTKAFGYKGELKNVKQKRVEALPIHSDLKEILAMAPKTFSEFVFVNPNTGRHYSKEINRIWNKACDNAGIKRIRLYQAVRHSYACQLLNAGVEKATVSRLLRHQDPRVIERYAKYEVATLEKAASKIRRLR